MEWLEIDHPLYGGLSSAFLPWKKTARRILLSNLSMSSVTFGQLTSLGTGQNADPFFRRERSAPVSSEEVRLIGFKSGKLTSVVTPCSLPAFLVGALTFLLGSSFETACSPSRVARLYGLIQL